MSWASLIFMLTSCHPLTGMTCHRYDLCKCRKTCQFSCIYTHCPLFQVEYLEMHWFLSRPEFNSNHLKAMQHNDLKVKYAEDRKSLLPAQYDKETKQILAAAAGLSAAQGHGRLDLGYSLNKTVHVILSTQRLQMCSTGGPGLDSNCRAEVFECWLCR